MATWILTGSPESYAAPAARGHTPIGEDAAVSMDAMRARAAASVAR